MAATRPDKKELTLEEIVREHAPRIYSLAWRLLGNDADAEDVTQEVLLQVLRKLDTFRGEANLSTWLHRVTVNAALGYRRKRANREKHRARPSSWKICPEKEAPSDHAGPARPWSVPPEQQALDHETRLRIEAAIAGLEEKYRDVFILADVEGLPNSEIAEMLGLGVPAVKSRLHRARLMMRKALAPYFEEMTP